MAVNDLRILDVYDAGSPGAATSRISDCISFGNASGTHDIVIRFAAVDSAAAPLTLGWLPCDASPAAEAVSLSTHVMNNLFWKPSSGVAGYVAGLQCDVWPANNRAGPAIYKFRLPASMASTPRVRLAKEGRRSADPSPQPCLVSGNRDCIAESRSSSC